MSCETEFKAEDFKGIGFKENWFKFDVLVAVCKEAKRPIKKRPVTHKLHQTGKKRSALFLIDDKDLPIKKRRLYYNARETSQAPNKEMRASVSVGNKKKILKAVEHKPDLPKDFYKIIAELREGKDQDDEPMLVIQKKLYYTDVDPDQSRLSIPRNQMLCEFLTEEEKKFISGSTKNKHKNAIEVRIIEPSLRVGTVKLRKWDYKVGKNMSYVLNGTWNDIVKNHNLRDGTTVQVWVFRVEQELCLALVNLSTVY